MDWRVQGVAESDMTEQLSLSLVKASGGWAGPGWLGRVPKGHTQALPPGYSFCPDLAAVGHSYLKEHHESYGPSPGMKVQVHTSFDEWYWGFTPLLCCPASQWELLGVLGFVKGRDFRGWRPQTLKAWTAHPSQLQD